MEHIWTRCDVTPINGAARGIGAVKWRADHCHPKRAAQDEILQPSNSVILFEASGTWFSLTSAEFAAQRNLQRIYLLAAL